MSNEMVNNEMVNEINDDEPLASLPKKKRTIFFLILYALFVIDFIARVGINAIFPIIQGDLQLSDGQMGSLASIVLLAMAVFVFPVAFLGEKYSTKKVISISAFVWGIGSFFSGIANSFMLLFVSRFMVGIGNSAYAPLSTSMVTSMYKKSDWGKKIGIYNTAIGLGTAAGALVFANIANTFGWRYAFYGVGAVTLILTVASLYLTDVTKELGKGKTTAKSKNNVTIKKALAIVGKKKSLLGLCLGAGLGALGLQAVLAFLSIYLVRIMNMEITKAAGIISIVSLIAVVCYPLGGMITDKWYKKDKRCRAWLPAVCYATSAICLMAGFYSRTLLLIAVGILCYTLCTTAIHAATQELVPASFKAISYSVWVLCVQLLGSLGPVSAGYLSEAMGLVNALVSIQIVFVVGTVVFLLSGRRYLKDYERAREEEELEVSSACAE